MMTFGLVVWAVVATGAAIFLLIAWIGADDRVGIWQRHAEVQEREVDESMRERWALMRLLQRRAAQIEGLKRHVRRLRAGR